MGNVNYDPTQYPWEWEVFSYPIYGRTFSLIQILNSDALLDQLIAKGPEDPDYQDEKIPYWADIWPSAIGLAEFMLMHPEMWEGQAVLEIGSGMGLPGMVAAQLGAKICITDYLSDAFDAARILWELNELAAPTCEVMDWRTPHPHLRSDIVLASDVIYEERNFSPLEKALPTLLSPEGYVLLSEPRRSYSQDFFSQLSPSLECIKVHSSSFEWKEARHSIDVYKITRK